VTSVADAEHLQNSSPNKTHRNVACTKKPAHETDTLLSLSWLMSCKSHLKHSKAFWHKIWTCNRLPQTLCLISWVMRSRTRTMSVYTRTLMRNYEEIRHFFQESLEVMKHQVYRYNNETKSEYSPWKNPLCPCLKKTRQFVPVWNACCSFL